MLSNGAIKSIYQLSTGIRIFAHDASVFDVGRDFGVSFKPEIDKWVVTRRWNSHDTGSGNWDAGHDLVGVEDGGGVFGSFESALRTALSLEFDARLEQACSEIGEVEQLEEGT